MKESRQHCCGIRINSGNPKYWEKNLYQCHLDTTNLKWRGRESNPGLRLSHGVAFRIED